MIVTLVAAVAENGVIGNDGEIPWHYPDDFAHFRETTMGSPMIMGRTTYESIVESYGAPLPGRESIVLTSTPETVFRTPDDPVYPVDTIDGAKQTADRLDDEAFVIGGESIYRQFLERADTLVLTEIPGTYEGDTYFPEWDESEWTLVSAEEEGDLHFVTYDRSV